MRTALASTGNRTDQIEKRISELKYRNLKITKEGKDRELRVKTNKRTLQDLSVSIRKSNMRIMVIPEGEEKKNGTESLLKEIIDENFQSLWKELDFSIEDTNKTPNYIVLMQKDLSKTHIIQIVKN